MKGEKIIEICNSTSKLLITLFPFVGVFGFDPEVDLLLHSSKLIFSSDSVCHLIDLRDIIE